MNTVQTSWTGSIASPAAVAERSSASGTPRVSARRPRALSWPHGVSPDAVPFGPRDVTAGCENEFQVAVSGKAGNVDLPNRIVESAYFRNLARRVASGDVPPRRLRELQEMISEEGDRVWENSWVAMRRDVLNPYAKAVLAVDLSRDKRRPGTLRADTGRFLVEQRGVRMLRIPVSYLMKLALAQALGQSEKTSAAVSRSRREGHGAFPQRQYFAGDILLRSR